MADKLIADLPHATSLDGTEKIEVQKGTGAGASQYATLAEALAAGAGFAANIGDGSSASFTLNHLLGTRDVHVTVFRNATPWDTVLPEVSRLDVDNVVISGFSTAPSTNQFRVLIRKN